MTPHMGVYDDYNEFYLINNIRFAYFKQISLKNKIYPTIYRSLKKWQWEYTFWEHDTII
jgi:hypothetical protein